MKNPNNQHAEKSEPVGQIIIYTSKIYFEMLMLKRLYYLDAPGRKKFFYENSFHWPFKFHRSSARLLAAISTIYFFFIVHPQCARLLIEVNYQQ
jgi:hypothetical protein